MWDILCLAAMNIDLGTPLGRKELDVSLAECHKFCIISMPSLENQRYKFSQVDISGNWSREIYFGLQVFLLLGTDDYPLYAVFFFFFFQVWFLVVLTRTITNLSKGQVSISLSLYSMKLYQILYHRYVKITLHYCYRNMREN